MTEQEMYPASPHAAEDTAPNSPEPPAEQASPTADAPPAASHPRQANGRADRRHRDADAAPVNVIPPKKIVRKLAVGMEVEGRVKRLSEFGAFIDIGVGRDGLVHISEVSVKRVNKIQDVLKLGDTVRAWIKELDRERNRISLTMIPPGTRTINDLVEGEIVSGTVTRVVAFGAFVDIGIEREGMLHVREMGDGYIAKPEDVVKVGETIEVRILRLDVQRSRIDLTLKGAQPEAEAAAAEPDAAAVAEPAAEVELPNAMEVAFEKARRAGRRDREQRERIKQRSRDNERRAELDDVIQRTLRMHREHD